MKALIGFLLSAVYFAGTVTASVEEALSEGPETCCKQYAQEDNVPVGELDSYLEEYLSGLDVDSADG
jgi:hypothetical protein